MSGGAAGRTYRLLSSFPSSNLSFFLERNADELGWYSEYGQPQGQAIFTDDVSLQIFMEHLKKSACFLFSPHPLYSLVQRLIIISSSQTRRFGIDLDDQ